MDLRARAGKTGDGSARVLVNRRDDHRFYSQPLANGIYFAKGHACLNHPKWSGIHAKKYNALERRTKSPQVYFMRAPGVLQRIINMRHRLAKAKLLDNP